MFELSELSEKNAKISMEMSEDLKKATSKIGYFHKVAKNSVYGISMILAHISEYPKEYFEIGSFKTIAEYAEEMFGYKKAYTYKLIKISRFVEIKSIEGESIPVKNLIEDKIETDYEFSIIKDSDGFEFSPSQLLELIPLNEEQLLTNVELLDSSLTCKELRETVRDIVKPPIEAKGEESKNPTEQEENKEQEEKTPLTDKDRILQMLEVCSGMEDEEIKAKIISVFQKALKALEK